MFKHEPNQPYYEIHLSDMNDKKMDVLSFEGKEKISGLYEYKVKIITKELSLDSSKILNRPATFTFMRGDETPEKVHGIISKFEHLGRDHDFVYYELTLVPKLWRLNLIYQNVVYLKMNINKLISEVLSGAGMRGSHLKIRLKNSYPEHEYIVQYRETSFNFLNRKLEHLGIFYYFEHSSGSDVVVFTDSNEYLPAIHYSDNVEFNENKAHFGDTETIIDFNCSEKVVTGEVKLKDYNYMFPEKQLTAQSNIDGQMPGVYYDFGDNFENDKEAEFLAKIRNQEFICQSRIFSGISDSRLLRSGFKFKLKDYFREAWNTEYIIINSSLKGSQPGLLNYRSNEDETTRHFECLFTAIPFDVNYRPARVTPVPKISGIMSAKIESGSGDEYAFIDDSGRYKAKMLFDLSDKSNGEATLPIRLSQGYSGPGYGIHFPNHAETELLWSCIDGNPDRPIGLGTVPNPSTATPVTSQNKMQNVIRTAAGNELIMDDKTKESQIIVNTTDANNMIFDDKDDKIQISTTQKHQVTMDDKNQNVTVQTKDGHLLILDDKNAKITVQSKNGHMICIEDISGSENITLVDSSGENTFVIDITNSKLVIKTENGNIDLHAPNGTIDVKATEFNLETTGDTSLKAANINSEAQTDYKVKGSNITEEATMDFKQKGMNIKSEASMEYKIKGLNVTSEAGVNQQVKGTMITVQSTGPNTIKGMPVMIN